MSVNSESLRKVDCNACTEAAVFPLSGLYIRDCLECSARALANGPLYWESRALHRLTSEYRAVLQKRWGPNWRDGHQAVRCWRERIEQARTALPCKDYKAGV